MAVPRPQHNARHPGGCKESEEWWSSDRSMPKKGLACELGKGIQGIPEITDPAPSLLCFLCPSCLQLIGNNSDHNSAVQPLENSLNDTKTCSFNLIFFSQHS